MQLILVRHGETDSNQKGTYLGWTDVILNENGVKQAHCAGEKLKEERIDGLFSSPLKRCLQTAEIINESHNRDIICSDALKEQNFGIWDNLTHKEVVGRFPEEYREYTVNWVDYCIAEGESPRQAFERVAAFTDRLLEDSGGKGTYVIVTHLGCIRNIIAHLLGLGIEGSWRFRVGNGSVTRIAINDENYAYLNIF